MKVIDLLNKIANGEEVPKKIIYKGHLYYNVCNEEQAYYENPEIDDNLFLFAVYNEGNLNDEVEIIEDTPKEDKKIEKLDRYEYIINCVTDISKTLDAYQDKINEIIDKVNGE